MAMDQIEVCGACEHYVECKRKMHNGEFDVCKVNKED